MKIEKVHAREVLDSRGRPTVEVEEKTRGGDVPLFLQVPQRVYMKRWSLGTAVNALWGEACSRQ